MLGLVLTITTAGCFNADARPTATPTGSESSTVSEPEAGVATLGSLTAGANVACEPGVPRGYTLFFGEEVRVGDLRRELARLGPIITDGTDRLYPGASDAAIAYRCWANVANSFIVYSIGPHAEFSEICEVTLADADIPPRDGRGPIC